MRTGMKESKKEFKFSKKMIAMLMVLVVAVFTVGATTVNVVTPMVGNFMAQHAEPANIDGENFELILGYYDSSVGGGATKLTEINWDAINKNEVRVIKQQVTYRNSNVSRDYAPGELVVTVKGLNDMYKNQSIDHIENGDIVIAADKASAINKQYDWSYTYDAITNTYTFINNRAIDKSANFEGSIQIAYNMQAPKVLQTERTDSAWLNNSVQSNEVTLDYTSNEKPYDVNKTAYQVQSHDGLPAGADDYIWVRYAFDIDAIKSTEVRNLDLTKPVYLKDIVGQSGCIVLDKDLNVINPGNDGTYSVVMDPYADGLKYFYQYMLIGYPKAQYEAQTIENVVDVYGTYEEENQVSYVGQSRVDVDLQYFGFEYTGELYDIAKESYPLTEVNYNPATKGHSVLTSWRVAIGAIYTGTPMTIRVGDDIVGMTLADGSYVKLTDDEYYFDRVDIHFNMFKNGNNVAMTPNKYTCKLFIRYAGSNQFTQYGAPFKNTNGTKTIDFYSDDVVGWYLEMYDVEETIKLPTYHAQYQIEPYISFKKSDGVGKTGQLFNFDFLEVFFVDAAGNYLKQNPVGLETYIEEMTKLNIAEYDLENYGKYLQRAHDYINYTDKSLYLYTSKVAKTVTKDLNTEYFYTSFDLSYVVNFEDAYGTTDSIFEGYRIYDILPDGVELNATEDEILDTLTNEVYHEIRKNDGTLFQSFQEYKQFIKDHSTVEIDYDYKGSGRTRVAIIVDLRDAPIDFIEFQGEYAVKYDTFNLPVKVSFDTYLEKGGKYQNYSQFMYIYDTKLKDAPYDTGTTGDPISADIDNDGKTTDNVVRGIATINILDAVASHQDVIKSVKTDLTNGEYWLDHAEVTPGAEYEYKLRVRTGENSIKGLVIYDNIETVETDNPKWQGTFVGVSTAEVEEKGFAPTVYYSTNEVTGTLAESNEWRPLVYDANKGLWVAPAGVNASTIKSVAIDLTEDVTGADKVVGRNSILYCTLVMKAPDEVPPEGVLARENMCFTNWNAINEDTGEAIDEITGINSNKVDVELDTTGVVTNISGIKTWNDQNNRYNVRPESITVNLLQDGVVVDTVTTDITKNWQYSFGNWPTYKAGVEKYVYTVEEEPILNYISTKEGFNINNTIELMEIEAEKIWEDDDDELEMRPDSIVLELYEGDVLVAEGRASEATGWKYTFTGLVRYNPDGTEKQYRIDEKPYENDQFYIKTINDEDYKITNTINISTEKIKIRGTKIWDDNNDFAGKRPDSITLQIKNGDVVVATQEVNEANNWSFEFEVPKYDIYGNEIAYTIDEGTIDSIFYQKELTDANTVTNKFEVPDEKIKLAVTKIWNDNNNAAGKRPENITLQVKVGNTVVAEQVVSQANNWTFEVELPKYDELGNEITYTIDEQIDSIFYQKENVDGNTITNTFVVPDEKIKFLGTKVWIDNEDFAGKRPDSVMLQVKNGDVVAAEQEVSAENNWSYEFELPKYDAMGNEIQYTLDENFDSIFYEKELTDANTITNTFKVPDEKIKFTGTKVWEDNNNEAGKRPVSITIQVKNSDTVVETKVLTETNNWTFEFELPKYDELGNEIEYTIDEADTNSKFYEKDLTDANTVTNRFTVPDERVNFIGTKIWEDTADTQGKRPESIILQVKNGTVVVAEQEVTAADNWRYEFTDLPKYDNLGNEIVYTLDEICDSEFYQKELTSNNVVTNKFVVPDDTVEIQGVKVWEDNNNQAGKRPDEITLQVKANGNVVAEQTIGELNGWKHTFVDLPKYDEFGDEIEYTIDEKDIDSIFYEKELADANTVVNTFVVPDVKISLNANKVWEDNDDLAEKRPESIVIQVKNGTVVVAEQEVSAENNWSCEFTDLPKYDNLGNEIVYTVDEVIDSIFYEKEISAGNIITNTFKVPDDKIKFEGTKVWNDNNNLAGKRPQSIVLQVKNGELLVATQEVTAANNWSYEFELPKYDDMGNEIQYTLDEEFVNIFYEKELTDANTVTNTFVVPDDKIKFNGTKIWEDNDDLAQKRPTEITLQVKDGDVVVAEQIVTAENNWSYEFELPKYDELGNVIDYTIDEVVDSIFYEKELVDANTIINTFVVPDDKIKFLGEKVWDDNDNEAGKRPESIVLQVKRGNTVVAIQEVTADTNWKYEFELPKYDDLGNEIEYTLDEEFINIFYQKELTDADTVTNKFVVPEDKIKFEGIKVWLDRNDLAGKRPESIILQVKNGNEVVAEQEVTADDNWSYEFELPKYDELGNEIEYTIDEVVDSIFYEKELLDNNIITNTFKVPDVKIDIPAIKVWEDNNDEAGKRPLAVVLQLTANGHVIDEEVVTELNGWTHTFTDLPKYDEFGNEIAYQVDEQLDSIFYDKELTDANTVTNTFKIPDDKIKFLGKKVWIDNDDLAGKRPDSIILQAKNGDVVVATQEVTAEDNWSYEFELPKYDEFGNEIEYTIDEQDLNSVFYNKELTDINTVTNIFSVPDEKVDIKGVKIWSDNDNESGKRPLDITLQLKAGNNVVNEKVINELNNWEYVFEGLPKYDEFGDEIKYTVDEKELDTNFYEKELVNANTLINTFTIPDEKIKFEGIKVWDDNDDLADKRPTSIILQVKNGDEVVAEQKVTSEDNWTYEFELPRYDEEGNEIDYVIDEKDTGSKFYQKEITSYNTVTNHFVVPDEEVVIKAVKMWQDNDDLYRKRPNSVVLEIYAGDQKIAEQKVDKNSDWSYEFTLPKYDELGNEIQYRVDEKDTPKHYEKKVDGYTVINTCTYQPGLMELPDTGDIAVASLSAIAIISVVGLYVSKSRLKTAKVKSTRR